MIFVLYTDKSLTRDQLRKINKTLRTDKVIGDKNTGSYTFINIER